MLTRPHRRSRNRRQFDLSNVPAGTTAITAFAISGGNAVLTLSAPCNLTGVPAMTVQGVLPISAVMSDPCHCTLHYNAAVIATNVAVFPDRDPALRTYNGGFVAAATHTF